MKHTQLFAGTVVSMASALVGFCSLAGDGVELLAFFGDEKALSAALS